MRPHISNRSHRAADLPPTTAPTTAPTGGHFRPRREPGAVVSFASVDEGGQEESAAPFEDAAADAAADGIAAEDAVAEDTAARLGPAPEIDVIADAVDAARFLRLSPRVVRELASEGKVPAARIGGSWRFSLRALAALVAGQPYEVTPVPDVSEIRTTAELAEDLGVSVRTVSAYRSRGLPSRLVGGQRLHLRSQVLAWMASQDPGEATPKSV